MRKYFKEIVYWPNINNLTLKLFKKDVLLIGSRQRIASLEDNIELSLSNTGVRQLGFTKSLGVTIDTNLTWDPHLKSIRHKVTSNL